MNLEEHANRYYKSLCLCDFPIPSTMHPHICATCGGFVPPSWRVAVRKVEVEQPRRTVSMRRVHPDVTLFLIVLLAVWALVHLLQVVAPTP